MLAKLSNHFYAWAKGRLILSVIAVMVLFMAITLPLAARNRFRVQPGA
jgi:hypothetical protein